MRIAFATAVVALGCHSGMAAETLPPLSGNDFGVCLMRFIPLLDDRISPADVVATGIVQACLSAHPDTGGECPSPACREVMADHLADTLLPFVLEFRVSRAPANPFDQFDPDHD